MSTELQLPPGFRFHPTDEELVMHYLCRKCLSQSIAVPIIAEIDLYKFDPWDLPDLALYGEKEWYFFSPRDRKYPNGSRPNRAAGSGYWKATGADKPIGQPKPVGIKKALVFYAGKAPKGEKTNWIMHEYRLADVDRTARKKNSLRLDDWVLCRIYNKKGSVEKQQNQAVNRKMNSPVMEEDRKPDIISNGVNSSRKIRKLSTPPKPICYLSSSTPKTQILSITTKTMEISSSLTLPLSSSARPLPMLSPSFSSSHSTFFTTGSLFSRTNFKTSSLVLSHRRMKAQNPKKGLSCNALFGLGVPELVVIAGVAALVFGPKKLPEVGKSIGKTVKSFQQAAKEFESELKKDPDSETNLPVEDPTAVNVEEKQGDKVPGSKESV